jgi:hypothetical protein
MKGSEPQGTLMALRVREGGGSKSLPVMGRIGVEPKATTVSEAKG